MVVPSWVRCVYQSLPKKLCTRHWLLCIDLIFTNHSNLVVDCEVHSSLCSNCHHKMSYCRLNLIAEYNMVNWKLEHFSNKKVHNWVYLYQNIHEKFRIIFQISLKHSCNYQRLPSISSKLSNLVAKRNSEYHNHISMKLYDSKKSAITYCCFKNIL